MTQLWFAIAGLSSLALIILFIPLVWSRHKTKEIGDQQKNIDIFKERLAELEQEKNEGTLDDQTFLHLKIELEKSLLNDVDTQTEHSIQSVTIKPIHWGINGLISVLVIGVSLGIYFKIGRSDDYALFLNIDAHAATTSTQDTVKKAPSFDKIIVMLEEKLKKNPQDLEKWFLLANTYSAIGQFEQSAEAFASAIERMPKDDPNLAAVTGSYAQMLFQAAGEIITSDTEKAMTTALTLDPHETSALILKGIQTYTQGDLKTAITYWEKAKTKASPHLLSSFIEPVITQTTIKLGQKPIALVSPQTRPVEKPAIMTSAQITIDLDIKPELKAKTKASDIIFVFAQKSGSRMPLAAERLQVKDLPKTILLDDRKSPMPTAKLSSVDWVDITARVSFSGSPTAAKGDLFVTIKKVAVKKSSKIEMLINQTVE